jgi:hypothetical protein
MQCLIGFLLDIFMGRCSTQKAGFGTFCKIVFIGGLLLECVLLLLSENHIDNLPHYLCHTFFFILGRKL